ncbi:MAG: TIGR04282 family arsenosugar biosynthesis glycosyltransferase [Chthoniobacterales bacterium]|nr:TIGR04282 family arsenosugar biosynthesis glycosyltransferase [Chthoniobacterales bacterium]
MRRAHRVLSPNEPDPAAAGRVALAIMTKVPRAGRVKTRLCPPLTPEEAAELNVCFLRDTAAAITQAGANAQGVGCYTPVGEEEAYRAILPEDFLLLAQREGGFGERLIGAIEDLVAIGFSAVCLIDSDSPIVPAAAFAEAVEVLSQPNDKVVLGPSDDGGYYLIGMKRLERRLFEEIDWSTELVLEQTKARAIEEGIEVHLLPTFYDVDDGLTLRRLHADLLGPNESAAPASREFLLHLTERDRRLIS